MSPKNSLLTRFISHGLRILIFAVLLAGLVWTAQKPGPTYAALSAGNETELTTAINSANSTPGATINLANNIYLTKALPEVTGQFTIEGGNYFISGESAYRVLSVTSSGKLTLHQVTVKNGKAPGDPGLGGGIFIDGGVVALNNSTVTGCTASDGGGLYNQGGALTVNSSTLSTNAVNNDGGGIYNDSGTLSLNNSTLSGNSADNDGGGILAGGMIVQSTVTISGGTFSGNTAANDGGGISNNDSMTLNAVTFTGNTAQNDGGAISSRSGTLSAIGSIFTGNTAANDGGGISNWDAAILSSSTLTANTSDNNGGGINNEGTLEVTNSMLRNNTANSGGGISNSGNATVSRSTLVGNSAGTGGGIYTVMGAVTLDRSTLSGNTAVAAGEEAIGGGIYNLDSTVKITASTLAGNSAPEGGGIFNVPGSDLSLAGVLLAKGSAGGNCNAAITDAGYNLADDAMCGFTTAGSKNNASLGLVALANNGGPTQTHALSSASEALNRIPLNTSQLGVSLCPASGGTDQRGKPRPNPPGGPCDAGAVEMGVFLRLYLPVIRR